MPETIPILPSSFIDDLSSFSFQEIAIEIAHPFLKEDLTEPDIESLIAQAINFPAPVVELSSSLSILELFYGPSLAFKDFGARFMAQLMSRLNEKEDKSLHILVATSGDTGGAVAAGFYDVPGIEVTILYPSGRVSMIQEKQLTTLGKNIKAIEVNGSFDDCQSLVKRAFLDNDLSQKLRLSSANSINIARLIPQSFYYFEGFKKCRSGQPIVFSIPSGNFGNLTAAVLAKKMGLAVEKIIAATNMNHIVPEYLNSGVFAPKKSIATISNAMDVGNPSNFARLLDLYDQSHDEMIQEIEGYYFTDELTKDAISDVQNKHSYLLDPHGAVGYLAAKSYLESNPSHHCIIVETAHPCKFDAIYDELRLTIDLPQKVESLINKEKVAIKMDPAYTDFKEYLMALS